MPPPILHLPALILHRSPWSESSWILRCLVADKGVVSVLAKGARRPKSPFAACLEPLNFVNLGMSYRSSREMQTLTEVQVLERFESLWGHMHAQALALSWIEWALALQVHEAHANDVLLDLLKALRFLNSDPVHALSREGVLSLRLMARMCAHEGFALQCEQCESCAQALDEHRVALLHKNQGAFVCQSCAQCSPDPAAVALWQALSVHPIQSPLWPRAEQLLLDYLCNHAPQAPKLKAREVLLSLRSFA